MTWMTPLVAGMLAAAMEALPPLEVVITPELLTPNDEPLSVSMVFT